MGMTMTGGEFFVLLNLVLATAAFLWLLHVVIPQSFDIALTRRLSRLRDDLDAIEARHPRTLAARDVATVDEFLGQCVASKRPLGLATAISLLVNWSRIRADFATEHTGELAPFRGLNQQDQHRITDLQERALRLLFRRAFLGSALWFVAWPGGLVADRIFRRSDPGGLQPRGFASTTTPDEIVVFVPEWSLLAVEGAVEALDHKGPRPLPVG